MIKRIDIRSLKVRYLVGSVGLLLTLFLVITFNANQSLKNFALQNIQSQISQTSETLNLAIVPYTEADDLDDLRDYMNGLIQQDDAGIQYLLLLDESGQILVRTTGAPAQIEGTDVPIEKQLSTNLVHIHQPILLGSDRIGQLYYGLSTSLLHQTRNELVRGNTLLLLTILVVSIVILSVFGLRASAQLNRLTTASKALADGHYDNRTDASGYTEISRLANNFNLMADAVEQRDAALRESEFKLRAMINNPALQIGLLDPNGTILSLNDAMQMLQSDRGTPAVGTPFWELDAFSNQPGLKNKLQHAVTEAANGLPVQFLMTYQVGPYTRHAEFSLQSVRDEKGQVHWLVPQALDITRRREAEAALARVNSEWTEAMDQFQDPVYLVDLEHKLVRANSAFYELVESTPEESLGQPVNNLIHAQSDPEGCPVCKARMAMQSTNITLEADDPHNPTHKPIEASLKVIHDTHNQVSGMLVSVHDLSYTRKIEERMKLSANMFENTAESIIITDATGTIIDVNPSFCSTTGFTREDVIGKNPRIWKSDRHDDDFFQDFWNSLNTAGHWQGELWNRRKDGTVFPEWQTISRLTDSDGRVTHFVAIATDISQIKRSQEQLDHIAHHDTLTNLPNRLLCNERLSQAIKHADRHQTQLAVMFLDLDNFKHINDSFGHPVGDQLLQRVAETLERTVRADDTVARVGGDEFVLILEDIGKPDNAGIAAEKILDTFSEPLHLEQQDIGITSSLGISLYPQDGKSVTELLRNADAAMYRAKEQGRNTYQFYTEDLTQNAFERVFLENSLRRAIERDELRLHYQPQVNMSQRTLVGVEALLRWQHPELGMVSPVRFIPLAEDCGLIFPIGRWVLEQACQQAKQWLDQGYKFGRISVNVSRPQLKRKELLQDVQRALETSKLDAWHLELELTESCIMEETESAIEQLIKLQNMGVGIAIDDFGTGYSSLSYLKQLPIHKLKIDQSFIRGISDDADDQAICHAIIAMSQSLGLATIAEGVEIAEQAKFLLNAGCLEAQGYFYSKPISADEFETILKSPTERLGESLPSHT